MSVALDVLAVQRRIAEIGGAVQSDYASTPSMPPAAAAARGFKKLVSGELQALVRRTAASEGVDAALLTAVVRAESGFDPRATSSAGAAGLMQLMPATAQALGVADPYDPAQNVRGGAAYLRELIDRFHGDTRLAVAAYNAGPGAVERYGGVPPFAETRAYVERVLAAYRANRMP
ncbi:MAG: lytic transglycosylase domain-containing protein [Candidatus Eremiobacteraeota bacterium]|nr:lytic transglycosylase domain-containing protein [Candidatus Eremiobacteraeota bacterium]